MWRRNLGRSGRGLRAGRRRGRQIAPRERSHVAHVVGPFGAIMFGEGARARGHDGTNLSACAGLCMVVT